MTDKKMTVVISGRIGFLGGKQGRIYGNPVADGWAGAIMQKNAHISKMLWDRPTDQHGKVVSCPRLKRRKKNKQIHGYQSRVQVGRGFEKKWLTKHFGSSGNAKTTH